MNHDNKGLESESGQPEELASLHTRNKARKAELSQTNLKLGKRALLLEAKKREIESHSWSQEFVRWMGFSKGFSAAAALCLLVVVVWYGQNTMLLESEGDFASTDFSIADFSTVKAHQLNTETQLASATLRVKYDEAYKDYLNQQGIIAAHHQTNATLRMSDEGWELATCDDVLVTVSDELVAMLKELERIDTDIQIGESVNIMYAMDGRIMQIIRANEPLRC